MAALVRRAARAAKTGPEERPFDTMGFRQSLIQLLEADSARQEEMLAELEARAKEGQPLYSSLLSILTHLSFPEAEARRHWRRIAKHRGRLRARMRRDVGLRVALLDYFVNLNRELKNPKIIEIAIYEKTERSAVTDGLTGLYNHAFFLQALKREVQRGRRHDTSVSVLLFDLDDFKKVNDTRGHVEGDRVLMQTAALVKENLREIDIAARYGGEEFVVVLPDTSRAGAFIVADRIRAAIEEHFRKKKGPHVTISGGVVTFPEDAATAEELVVKADAGLYKAKASGKNLIVLVEPDRRRHVRLPALHRVIVSARELSAALCRAKNVSEGGLLVTLKERVDVGSRITIAIRPGKDPTITMDVHGEVVRVDEVKRPKGKPVFDIAVKVHGEMGNAGALLGLGPAAAHRRKVS